MSSIPGYRKLVRSHDCRVNFPDLRKTGVGRLHSSRPFPIGLGSRHSGKKTFISLTIFTLTNIVN